MHPRTRVADRERSALRRKIWDHLDGADLTVTEALAELHEVQLGLLKHQLREERHNHLDEHGEHPKGDEACEEPDCPGNYHTGAAA